MREADLLIRGMIAGLIIAAPVGPVNVFCINRTTSAGWKRGIVAGVGAALADTVYGAIAGFSISLIINLIIRELYWVRLFGGMLLIGIGISYLLRSPRSLKSNNKGRAQSDLAATFLLNLTNPTTVLSFLAVLAALRIDDSRPWWQTAFLVGGIFLGSMAWWLILSTVISHFREKIDDRVLLWMNRAAGIAIGCFGAATMLLSRKGF